MSNKTQWPRQQALEVAKEIHATLLPFCHRCKICGSLRRGWQTVGDIEVLFIPKVEPNKALLFPDPSDMVNLALQCIDRGLMTGWLLQRPNCNGSICWGERNRLAIHASSGIPVDFFATTEQAWFNSLVIRTGGKITNLKLTTSANRRGLTLHAYGDGFTNLKTGEKIQTHSEEEVFKIAGVPYTEPRFRA